MKRMLIAHLILLIQTVCTMKIPEDFTEIETTNIQIATEDIQKGKIVTRVKDQHGRIYYMNIRHLLDNFTIPEMQHYEIGLGRATTRTNTQQAMANRYTKNIVEQAYDNIIFVDGSINSKDNPHHNKYGQSGFGGCGGVLISKINETQTPKAYFREKINTN